MSSLDLVLVLRYRKAVTYGFHVLKAGRRPGGDPTGVTDLAYRDETGKVVKTGRPERLPLDTFRGFSLRWQRFNALEITRGCAFSCAY